MGPVTATSASWKVMARACRTTRAPILINFSCRLVSDQSGTLDTPQALILKHEPKANVAR